MLGSVTGFGLSPLMTRPLSQRFLRLTPRLLAVRARLGDSRRSIRADFLRRLRLALPVLIISVLWDGKPRLDVPPIKLIPIITVWRLPRMRRRNSSLPRVMTFQVRVRPRVIFVPWRRGRRRLKVPGKVKNLLAWRGLLKFMVVRRGGSASVPTKPKPSRKTQRIMNKFKLTPRSNRNARPWVMKLPLTVTQMTLMRRSSVKKFLPVRLKLRVPRFRRLVGRVPLILLPLLLRSVFAKPVRGG